MKPTFEQKGTTIQKLQSEAKKHSKNGDVKQKSKKTRRTLKKNVHSVNNLVLFGTNCNGITSKKESLYSLIECKNPGAFFLQETKVHRKGLIKIENYEIFEVVRKKGLGGCILTGVHKSLNPILINDDDELEILTVQAQLGNYSCRFINAYGPKEGNSKDDQTIAFFAKIDQEIKNAKLFGHLCCLQLDANAKLGKNIIPNDPHNMSSNGQLLYDVITRNSMIVCNSLETCEGTITRRRTTVNGLEESIIDYFIICQDFYSFFVSMKIDSNSVLTRYVKKKNKIYITKSDHNLLICEFSQKWNSSAKKNKMQNEFYNFKDAEGLIKFKELTSDNTLLNCFNGGSIVDESNLWFKKFRNIIKRSFPIIRISDSYSNQTPIRTLMLQKAEYMKLIDLLKKSNLSKDRKIKKIMVIFGMIERIDISIADMCSEKNAKLIRENFSNLSTDGNFNLPKMWTLKKKLRMDQNDAPTAMLDKSNNLVTSYQGIINLYQETYKERLSPKPPLPEYEQICYLKEYLFEKRYDLAASQKSKDWTISELMKVCKNLKNGKARDSYGMIFELFKPQI